MKRTIFLPFFLVFISLIGGASYSVRSATVETKPSPPLGTRENLASKFAKPTEAVKTFFTALKDKDFDLAWESLSLTSQNRLIQSFASQRKMSVAQAKEYFEKNKEKVRDEFWTPFRDRSTIVPLVQDAVYLEIDAKEGQAMVEMKSGGVTNHIKAIKEGGQWRMGYVESALQDQEKPRATPQTMPKEGQSLKVIESAPGGTPIQNEKYK